MGSVPNCRKEIADRYPIRWFKCKLKPPKKDRELMEIKEASYEAKLNEMAKQIETIKAESTKQKVQCPPQPSARKSLGTLRKEVFDTLPGTVNPNRGSALPSTGLSVNWDEHTLPQSNKQVHFGCMSTPQHTLPIDLYDESEDIISGSNLSSSKPKPAPRSNRTIDHTCAEGVAALHSIQHCTLWLVSLKSLKNQS